MDFIQVKFKLSKHQNFRFFISSHCYMPSPGWKNHKSFFPTYFHISTVFFFYHGTNFIVIFWYFYCIVVHFINFTLYSFCWLLFHLPLQRAYNVTTSITSRPFNFAIEQKIIEWNLKVVSVLEFFLGFKKKNYVCNSFNFEVGQKSW